MVLGKKNKMYIKNFLWGVVCSYRMKMRGIIIIYNSIIVIW